MHPIDEDLLWGEATFQMGEPRSLQLGNLVLTVERTALEWSVEYLYRQDRYVNETRKETTRYRVASRKGSATMVLRPATADRNVVVRPVQRLEIPNGEAVRLYIGTPVWVKAVGADGVTLFDLPSEILSDTWFGVNTREGEVCYANQTQARLELETLTQRRDRLITPVEIENEGQDALVIERLNLPLPQLSVYGTEASIWTQTVKIRRTAKLEAAEIHIANEPPPEQPGAALIAGPRIQEDAALVARALGLLLDSRRSL